MFEDNEYELYSIDNYFSDDNRDSNSKDQHYDPSDDTDSAKKDFR